MAADVGKRCEKCGTMIGYLMDGKCPVCWWSDMRIADLERGEVR